MLDIEKLRRHLLEKINTYNTETIKRLIDNEGEKVTLQTNTYKFESIINSKWIGFDFAINKALTNNISAGASVDTDLYPLDFDTDVSKEIYDEMINFIDDLLSDKIYYGVKDNKAIFARPDHRKNQKDSYKVRIYPKGFFKNIKTEEWSRSEVEKDNDLRQLIANAGYDKK